jgi:hypothetical protein
VSAASCSPDIGVPVVTSDGVGLIAIYFWALVPETMALHTVSSRTLRLCLYGCLAVCVAFGSLALADDLLGTSFWPDNAEYGTSLLALAGVYCQLLPDRETVQRWRVRAVACLAFGLLSLLCMAYTDPVSPLSAVPFVLLIVGATVAYRGLYREWANPHP